MRSEQVFEQCGILSEERLGFEREWNCLFRAWALLGPFCEAARYLVSRDLGRFARLAELIVAPDAQLEVAGWDEWLEYCAGDISRAVALGKYTRYNETIRRTAWELDMMTEWQYLEAMEIPQYDIAITIKTLDLDKI